MKEIMLFTSEAVSEGHPDKVCDQIADAILDACLALDPLAHVAIECFAAKQKLLIGGEVRFSSTQIQRPDFKKIAKQVMTEIGYTNKELDAIVKLNKRIIELQCKGFDKYGRVLVEIPLTSQVGGADAVNMWMVENNYGYSYSGGTRKAWDAGK